jgi:hypothetical protein
MRATRAVVIALLLLLGPGAAAASADMLSLSPMTGTLQLTGTGANNTITLGPGTLANEYRFTTSPGTINVDPSAAAICGDSGAVVECDDKDPVANADVVNNVTVNGAGASDNVSMTGAITTASVTLDGGPGNDALTGGPGNESLVGAGGSDRLEGGAGVDSFRGADGADTILARDGAGEQVRCGAGADSVTADSADTYPANDCENISLPGGTSPPPPPPPPPSPSSSTVVILPPSGSSANTSVTPLSIGLSAAFELGQRGTRVARLTLKNVPDGVTLRLRCKSPSRTARSHRCPFSRTTVPLDGGVSKIALAKHFKNRSLAPRTVFTLFLTAPRRLGASVRFKVRSGRAPVRTDSCVNSALRPVDC